MMKRVQEHQLGLQHARNSRTKGNKSTAGVFSCVCVGNEHLECTSNFIKHNIEQEEMVCVGNTTNTFKKKKRKIIKRDLGMACQKNTNTQLL